MRANISEELRLKLDALPTEPGIYLMKRKDGEIIYIGKAKNLRSRVRSYFQDGGHDGRRQFKALVRNIADLDCIVTATEQEALILEATQIRAHKPRYNIQLKDDKKYPFIRITNEAFPRIFSTRTIVRDGSRYLGPYSNVRAMHTTLDMLRKIFPVRSCDFNLPTQGVRLCLEYHIKRCEGPCEQKVDEGEYKKTIDHAVRFLRGKNSEVLKAIRERMEAASESLQFERQRVTAISYRRSNPCRPDKKSSWMDLSTATYWPSHATMTKPVVASSKFARDDYWERNITFLAA